MGFEYRLRFSCEDESAVLRDLVRLRGATQTGPTALEFRSADNVAGKMPDATLQLEPGGAYFCDFGGVGSEFMGCVVSRLVARCGAVTVEDWE
jgi:hypothetical protein